MSRSDRERGEGFHRSRSGAAAVLSAVAVPTASERAEGSQHSGSSAVAVPFVAEKTASERAEGFQRS